MKMPQGWSGAWKRGLLVAVLAIAAARPAAAQFCSNCVILNGGAQNGAINIGTATIRGFLTVSTVNVTYLNISGTLTAAAFAGDGGALTGLNANYLTVTSTVPAGRLTGAYPGITGIGTVAAGTWHGAVIAPQYGGTGADLHISGTAGGVPYFTGSGVQGVVISPGTPMVLVTAGSGATPQWTSSPTLTGQNFSAIPLTALNSGHLPHSIAVDTNSIANVQGAGVLGNIPGGAAFLTVALPVANLAGGTLPTANAASSITVTGVPSGTFGGPTTVAQFRVGTDGRLYDAKQFNLVIYSTQVISGPLPPGVTIAAGQVSSGTLANNVVASSVAATGVSAGTYGGAALALTAVVGGDGRLSSLTQQSIALPLSQLNAGTLPGTVLVPAASIQAGNLANNVVASSLAVNGVPAGVYGSPTTSAQLTIGSDGRVTNAMQYPIPGVSTATAFIDRDNNWKHAQTSPSTWTFLSNVLINGGLIISNPLPPASGGTGNNWASVPAGGVPYFSMNGALGVLASGTTNWTLTMGSNGLPVWAASASSATHLSGGAAGSLPYQSAPSVTTFLAKSTNGWALEEVAGLPAWVAAVSSATNLAGGAAGSLPYQSAANTSSLLAVSVNGYALQLAAGLPSWVAAVSSATNLAGGAANSLPYQSAANMSAMLAAGSGVLQEVSSGVPAWTLTPTLTGTNFSGIPLAALNSGGLATNITVSTANIVPGFNSASELVQLNGSGNLPALNGAALTSLTPANMADGQFPTNVQITTANVAPGFNSASEIVQLNAQGALPAVPGFNLTGISTAVIVGTWGDTRVSLSTGAIISGKFGDNLLAFSSAALVSGKWQDTQLTNTFNASSITISNASGLLVTYGATLGSTTILNAETVIGTMTVLGGTGGGNYSLSLSSGINFVNAARIKMPAGSLIDLSAGGGIIFPNGVQVSSGGAGGGGLTQITNNSSSSTVMACNTIYSNAYTSSATYLVPSTLAAGCEMIVIGGSTSPVIIAQQNIATGLFQYPSYSTSASFQFPFTYSNVTMIESVANSTTVILPSDFSLSNSISNVVRSSITTLGTTTWNVPSNVSTLWSLVCAGGGGGASGSNSTSGGGGTGGGGGGSGHCVWTKSTVTPGSGITAVIGDGGTGGTAAASGGNNAGVNGNSGSSSSFGAITSTGGVGGFGPNTSGNAATGGSGYGGGGGGGTPTGSVANVAGNGGNGGSSGQAAGNASNPQGGGGPALVSIATVTFSNGTGGAAGTPSPCGGCTVHDGGPGGGGGGGYGPPEISTTGGPGGAYAIAGAGVVHAGTAGGNNTGAGGGGGNGNTDTGTQVGSGAGGKGGSGRIDIFYIPGQ